MEPIDRVDLEYLTAVIALLSRYGVTEFNCQAFSICFSQPEIEAEVGFEGEEDTDELEESVRAAAVRKATRS